MTRNFEFKMRLQIIFSFVLTTVFFNCASFSLAGGAVNFNTLDKVSSPLHHLDNKPKAVEVLKKNSE